jgi:hypothetical protein
LIPFKEWIVRNYSDPELRGHHLWIFALDVQTRWANMPDTGSYMDLAVWLSDHDACKKKLKSFKIAWDNYVNDG